MHVEHFQQFFPAICAGLGLFLIGAVNLALLGRGVVVRVFATTLAVGTALGFASSLDQPGVSRGTARLLLLVVAPYLMLTSPAVARRLTVVIASLRRPCLLYGLLTIAGGSTILGSIVLLERSDKVAADATLAELELIHARARVVPAARHSASTDYGTAVALKEPGLPRDSDEFGTDEARTLSTGDLEEHVIRRGAAGNRANCHGWVFTGGKFVLGPTAVALILRENDYQEVPKPQPGDLVIYRQAGEIAHTAIVRYVSEELPVLVEGKWGPTGVFLHPIDKSPYGTGYTFYRSSRSGHLLAGIGGSVQQSAAPPLPITE